jgi:hypothetical protein
MKRKGERCEFLVTPGGFLKNDKSLADWKGPYGWNTLDVDTSQLFEFGNQIIENIKIFDKIIVEGKNVAQYLTIGLDLTDWNEDKGKEYIAELVCFIDLKTKKKRWTGKSYPTPSQQNNIVLVSDIDSHFIRLSKRKRICILGCHDLNLFSHRTFKNTAKGGNRRAVINKFKKSFKIFEPQIIIQHPHSTDTPNIWKSGWAGVNSDYKFVKSWVSGIAHCLPNHKCKTRANRIITLEKTIRGTSLIKDIGDLDA